MTHYSPPHAATTPSTTSPPHQRTNSLQLPATPHRTAPPTPLTQGLTLPAVGKRSVDNSKKEMATEALALLETITHSIENLANSVLTKRASRRQHRSGGDGGDKSYEYDPRLLAFEFITGFMIRQMQVS